MPDLRNAALERAGAWIARGVEFGRHRRTRRVAITLAAIIIFYGLIGYFGVPIVLRRVATGPLARALHRPVTIGRIDFQPYTLRLDIDQLRIGDRDRQEAFVKIGHLRLRAAWASLIHLAPIVHEVIVTKPQIHLVRTANRTFNFSDLLATPAASPRPPPSKPTRFAVSNIQVTDGSVEFDDQVLKEQHHVNDIQIGVPFVANLPADTAIYVQPLLQMVIDGSPLRLTGKARPFAVPAESVLDLNLHRLNLARYLGYLPPSIPIKIPTGTFSCAIQMHFINAPDQPLINLAGAVALDQVDVRDAAGAPLVGLNHAVVTLDQVEPLAGVIHLGRIHIDGLTPQIVLNADGTTNLTPFTKSSPSASTSANAANPAPAALPARSAANPTKPAAAPPTTSAPAKPLELVLKSFALTNSAVKVTDNRGPAPAALTLQAIHFTLTNLQLGQPASPAPFDLAANLSGGGTIAVKGSLDLAGSQAKTDVALDQIDLPALQGFASQALAATVTGGKLTIHATVTTGFAPNHLNLHVEPATIAVAGFALRAPQGNAIPVQWQQFTTNVGLFDLASRQVTVNDVTLNGLHLEAERSRDGRISLASLLRQASAAPATPAQARPRVKPRRRVAKTAPAKTVKPAKPPTPAAGAWQYRVAAVTLDRADLDLADDAGPKPLKLAIAPLNLHLKDLSNDLAKPLTLALDGVVNRKGSFKITGTASPIPLKANLRVNTRLLDLAMADPYVTSHLNATIASALLTTNGAVALATTRRGMRINYNGDLSVSRLRMLDKLTNEPFLRWNNFTASGIRAEVGDGPPKVRIAGLALADFYARVILNRNGRLNLSDVTTNPAAAPTSLTRAEPTAGARPAPPPPAVPQPPATPPSPSGGTSSSGARIDIGHITLQGGQINYSDYFIKPNYTADLTEVGGQVGAFGTGSTTPATVALQGQVNGNAPLNISGSVNPLSPLAFVDLTAKADGVELESLTPYSTKYTGYPITSGTLTVDVHYLLDSGKLTADNKILIDQLTFGDRVENSTARNLPLRLAVALLKDANGQIKLDIPVSGSLSDPQFSIGGIILHALLNIIVKAVTSPFRLLAAVVGGGNEQLAYVEFAPGLATLTPASQKPLDTLAKALQARKGLRLDITGRVDPAFDQAGLRLAKVDQMVAAAAQDSGEEADTKGKPLPTDEYNKYLKRVYKAAKFPKPKDLIGLNKSLPPDEMKKLLATDQKVSPADLKQLAEARANAVRSYLSTKIDPARLLVKAPKLDAAGIKDKGKTTRADLSLE